MVGVRVQDGGQRKQKRDECGWKGGKEGEERTLSRLHSVRPRAFGFLPLLAVKTLTTQNTRLATTRAVTFNVREVTISALWKKLLLGTSHSKTAPSFYAFQITRISAIPLILPPNPTAESHSGLRDTCLMTKLRKI